MQGPQGATDSTSGLSTAALTSLRFLRHRVDQAAAKSANRDTFLTAAAQSLASAIGQDCIAWVHAEGKELRVTGLNLPLEGLSETVQRSVAERAAEAMRSGLTHVSLMTDTQTLNCVAAPVVSVPSPGCLVILHSAQKQSLPFAVAAAELVAACIAAAEFRRETVAASREANDAGALVDMLARTESAGDLTAATVALCSELRQFFGCTDAILGLKPDDDELIQYSARADENARVSDDERLALNAALHESLMQARAAKFPAPPGGPRHALLAHRQLASELSATTLVSCPLRTEDGAPHGAIILVGTEDQLESPDVLGFLEAAEPRLAATVSLLERSERKGLERVAAKARAIVTDQTSRGILAAVAGLALLMCIPLPYKVKANCELQPLNHRYVAAPFEAPLEECLVEPGDMVEPDQLLARIDGREIRLNLAEVASDRNRSGKERDMHRAKGEYGAAEMSRLEMEAHQARAALLEHRGQNLEIRSPSSGVVVSGDWKKSEGVPLKTGETMFEIAPLGRMIVQVGIPEDDITHIKIGQTVTVRMDAYASDSWTGKLLRVHPAAEMRDNEHVFIGELELDNPDLRLRPGMRGTVKITTPARPVFWNIFHKPWNAMIAWIRYAI